MDILIVVESSQGENSSSFCAVSLRFGINKLKDYLIAKNKNKTKMVYNVSNKRND